MLKNIKEWSQETKKNKSYSKGKDSINFGKCSSKKELDTTKDPHNKHTIEDQ